MKKILLTFVLIFALTSCERNEGDLVPQEQEMNFNQTPNPALDNQETAKGLYVGTIKTIDETEGVTFHEIITLNLANDGNYFAYINRQNGEEMIFLTENTVEDGVLIFKTENSETTRTAANEFTVTIVDNYPTISNVIINGRESTADFVRGDSSRGLPLITMGEISGDKSGTFDINFYAIGNDKFEADGLAINIGSGFTFGTFCQPIPCNILPDGGIAYNRYCAVETEYVFSAYESEATTNYMILDHALSFTLNLSSGSASCNDKGSFPLSGFVHEWIWNGNSGALTILDNTLPLFPVGG